ncbi:peroxisomal biogenesis factor 19 [Teleopsis dalmanni]|uniref:peroxisomal biogenesis factor 19 n=1 Tax=Teleopsis dalmanni TaxID=139649 RepID=UPI0018CC8CB9|nr:peroxisomal biogenesis factor 19 [Teleopsis dalmanni]
MAEENHNDKDLNDLLDSALEDFDKTTTNSAGGDASASNSEATDTEKFIMEQTHLLAERMSSLFGAPDTPTSEVNNLTESGFKKMAEAAVLTLEGENPANDDEVAKYSDIIAQALTGLQEGSENLASSDHLSNMFQGLNLFDSSDGEGNAFLPLMEGMMQSLLSPEILLPSIKELLTKYPKYLEDNADKLSPEDKERYTKQLDLYRTIEGHLESQNATDNAHIKREKFKTVLEDMRKLQEYGQPPEDIIELSALDSATLGGDMAGGSGMGASGNPQCPMM